MEWHKLDLQVSRALPQFARDWGELARRVQKTPEWNRFKWLSMDEGENQLASHGLRWLTESVTKNRNRRLIESPVG